MTIVTKGMGAIIKNIFKSRGRKPSAGVSPKLFDLEKKGVVDRNISSKKIFKNMKKGKK